MGSDVSSSSVETEPFALQGRKEGGRLANLSRRSQEGRSHQGEEAAVDTLMHTQLLAKGQPFLNHPYSARQGICHFCWSEALRSSTWRPSCSLVFVSKHTFSQDFTPSPHLTVCQIMVLLNFCLVLVSRRWCFETGLSYAAQADSELRLLSPWIAGIASAVPTGPGPKVFLCGVHSSLLQC